MLTINRYWQAPAESVAAETAGPETGDGEEEMVSIEEDDLCDIELFDSSASTEELNLSVESAPDEAIAPTW